MSCIKVNRCLQEEIAFGSQSESARRKPAAISIFRIQKNTVNRTSKDDHFSIALIRLQLSCQNAQCIKLHRQLYSVCLLWVRKRRGENVRDRKAGLGRVLFTSSSFRGFRMVEIEPFGRRCWLSRLLFIRTEWDLTRGPRLSRILTATRPASTAAIPGPKALDGPLLPPVLSVCLW